MIVTSATIDAERFASTSPRAKGPAPVDLVSGRMFPVEQRWRPFEEIARLRPERRHRRRRRRTVARPRARGDILVFLPGEREIREAADHLRKHLRTSR